MDFNNNDVMSFSKHYAYRAKPVKPRVGLLKIPKGETETWEEICVMSVELTDSVKEALKQAGIDYDS